MNKTFLISVIIFILIVFSYIFIFRSKVDIRDNSIPIENSEIKNGIQYITINAKGGYSPKVSFAKAGIPTKLIVKTNGSYDCSSSLVIRSLGFQKILPQTGETEIDVGVPETGIPLQGVCSMGMYNFLINFN